MVRKLCILILLLSVLVFPVGASETALQEIEDGIPPQAQTYMPDTESGFLSGLMEVAQKALLAVVPGLKDSAAICAGVLAATILCTLFCAGDTGRRTSTANLLGVAAIGTLLVGKTNVLITQGLETIQSISDYGKLLLPVMSASLVASGGTTKASALYLGTALFDSVLCSLISKLLAPMLYLFLALALGAAAIGSDTLGRMRDFFKNVITWGLKCILSIFTTYMAITGVVSGSADATAVKLTKMTISGLVPVVGGIISDATETVLVGAAAVRSTAGVIGLLAVLSITAGPFLTLAVQNLLLKLTAALCSVVGGGEHSAVTEGFAQAMGLILAMVGAGCLLQMISIVCFMKGVG